MVNHELDGLEWDGDDLMELAVFELPDSQDDVLANMVLDGLAEDEDKPSTSSSPAGSETPALGCYLADPVSFNMFLPNGEIMEEDEVHYQHMDSYQGLNNVITGDKI